MAKPENAVVVQPDSDQFVLRIRVNHTWFVATSEKEDTDADYYDDHASAKTAAERVGAALSLPVEDEG